MLAKAALTLLLAAAGAHPQSQSSSRIVVQGRSVDVVLECQTLSLIECVPIDESGDQRLDAGELERGRAVVERYLAERYRVSAAPGAPVELGAAALEIVEPPDRFSEQRLRATWRGDLPEGAAGLVVDVRLFLERNPFHRDFATIEWNGEAAAPWVFEEGRETWTFEPQARRRPGVIASFVELGIEHILIGYDHIAFLVALIVASRRMRSLVAVVTAFTVAHSLTLGSAALGLVSAPSAVVELAIALSIAYVGAENLLFRRPTSRWFEGFAFGLVHGLGFATVLESSLAAEPLRIAALFGFNLGVELGQLAIVATAALALRWLPGDRAFEDEPRAWLAPRNLRLGASALVTALGLWWFAQRAGWIPWEGA
jgi:hydrogenase/urease accessory protein HupE